MYSTNVIFSSYRVLCHYNFSCIATFLNKRTIKKYISVVWSTLVSLAPPHIKSWLRACSLPLNSIFHWWPRHPPPLAITKCAIKVPLFRCWTPNIKPWKINIYSNIFSKVESSIFLCYVIHVLLLLGLLNQQIICWFWYKCSQNQTLKQADLDFSFIKVWNIKAMKFLTIFF